MTYHNNSMSDNEIYIKEKKSKVFASWTSLIVGFVLMLFKFWAHRLSGSQAILSDALESIVNVVAAGLALFVIYYGSKPADQDHPYGHGKIEYFSSTFEGGLISFAGFFIMLEAVIALFSESKVIDLDESLLIIFATGVANALLGLYLVHSGNKNKSIALRASGRHILSDVWTTVGIIVGLMVVKVTGIYWLDSVIAILVSLLLFWTGFGLVKESVSGLLDAEDENVLQAIQNVFDDKKGNGIIQVHHVKVIRAGNYHHIDAHMVIAEFWDIKTVHEKVKKFEDDFLKSYKWQGEMNFHFDPCRRVYCRQCDLVECPIRIEKFVRQIPLSLEEMRSVEEPDLI